MGFIRRILITTLGLFYSAVLFGASISEVLVNGSAKTLKELGFKDSAIIKVHLETMFLVVFPNDKVSSVKLKALVDGLASEDPYFKDLQRLLQLDSKSVSFNDIEKAVIDTIKISHIRGKNLVCTNACKGKISSTLDKVSIVKISDPDLILIREKLSKMSSSQLSRVVESGINGSIPATLDPIKKKQLAFFFLMKKSKSQTHRKFVKVVETLAKKGKRVDLLGHDAKFYLIPSTISHLGENEFQMYIKLLEMTNNKRILNPGISVESAYFASFDDITNEKFSSPEIKDMMIKVKKEMRDKNCLFN